MRSGCPNKNVFSYRLNREYDTSAFRKFGSKVFQTLVAEAAKVLFPKQLDVQWTVSVLVSAERSCFARASVTSWQNIGKVSRGMTGQGPIDERRYLEHNTLPDRQPEQLTKHW